MIEDQYISNSVRLTEDSAFSSGVVVEYNDGTIGSHVSIYLGTTAGVTIGSSSPEALYKLSFLLLKSANELTDRLNARNVE